MASTPDRSAGEGGDAGPVQVPDYEVGPLVREGWAGTIREAHYLPTGLRLTLQTLRPDLSSSPAVMDRLARVGRQIAAVRHPNLVGVFDVVEDGATHHLVAEWSDWPTLATRLRTGALGTGEVAAILDDVLAGLTVLHRAGSFHGHVGPDTVVTEPRGPARLAELGICAAAVDGAGPASDVAEVARMGLALLPAHGAGVDDLRAPLLAAVASGGGGAAALRGELRAVTGGAPGAQAVGGAAPPVRARPRRRRRWLLVATAAVAAVAGGVTAGLVLNADRPAATKTAGPLAIGGDARLTVSPPRAGCNTTFVFIARGSLTGTGALVYRWEESDGAVSSRASLPVRANDGSFQLTQAWRLQGSQTVDGSMTLHILAPVDRRLHQAFQYTCP